MKELKKSIKYVYKSVNLYLDDIKKIYELMKSHDSELTMTNDDYIFDNVDELMDLKRGSIDVLKIQNKNFDMRFELSEHGVELNIDKDTPTAMGIYIQIKEIIEKRKRRIIPLNYICGIGIGSGFTICLYFFDNVFFRVIGATIAILSLLLGYFTFQSVSSKIILKYKIDSPPFIKRNLDSIIVSIIFLLLGIILTVMAQKLFGIQL